MGTLWSLATCRMSCRCWRLYTLPQGLDGLLTTMPAVWSSIRDVRWSRSTSQDFSGWSREEVMDINTPSTQSQFSIEEDRGTKTLGALLTIHKQLSLSPSLILILFARVLFVYVSVCLSLSLFLSVCLSASLSLSLSLSDTLSVSFALCVPAPPTTSFSPTPSLSLLWLLLNIDWPSFFPLLPLLRSVVSER